MIKYKIIILTLLIISLKTISFSKPNNYFINIRPTIGIGNNIGGSDSQFKSTTSYLAGLDVFFNVNTKTKTNMALGIELGYFNIGKYKNSQVADYLDIALIAEGEYNNIIMQIGGVIYNTMDKKVHQTQYGFLLGAGYEIRMNRSFSLPVILRADFLESNKISLNGTLGLSLYF